MTSSLVSCNSIVNIVGGLPKVYEAKVVIGMRCGTGRREQVRRGGHFRKSRAFPHPSVGTLMLLLEVILIVEITDRRIEGDGSPWVTSWYARFVD